MTRKVTPLRAIRLKCLDCCVYQPKEVRLCPAVNCPLNAFRFGKLPNKTPVFSEKSRFRGINTPFNPKSLRNFEDNEGGKQQNEILQPTSDSEEIGGKE